MIGLYGGTCNNLYAFAKAFNRWGFPICFIVDRKDNFPHSQPVWEDVETYFVSGFDYVSINWEKFEQEMKWNAPEWFFYPQSGRGGKWELFSLSKGNVIIRAIASRFLCARKEMFSVLEKMMACDFLVVCGLEPAILAMLSGKPYFIFPHGSEMRVAIGVQKKVGIKGKIVEYLLRKSFMKAVCVGSSLPDGSAEVQPSTYKQLKDLTIERVPIPYTLHARLPYEQRREKLSAILTEFGVPMPGTDTIALSPSRINFHWKGHDRLIEAITLCRTELKMHFLFLGWGDDYLEAQAIVKEQKLQNWVTIIPVFLSKGMLFKLFKSVDLVIDALNGNGGYGTSLSEAMSCGCPVVTWISDMFDKPGWERPPVIQARSRDDLVNVISQISDRRIDLEEWSRKTVEWFQRVHGNDAVRTVFNDKFANYLHPSSQALCDL